MKFEIEVLELSDGGYIGLCRTPGGDPWVTIGTPTESEADVARRSLGKALSDDTKDDLDELMPTPMSTLASRVATDRLTIIDLLKEAADDQREVRISYRSILSEPHRLAKTKVIKPLSVVLRGQGVYAEYDYIRAVERYRDVWRTFRIDNITRAEFA